MRLKLISCDVFEREVKAAASRASNQVEVEILPKAPHQLSDPDKVVCLQALIDRAGRSNYHAVLLVAGSCKQGFNGLVARSIPLVLPRAKDCISLLMDGAYKAGAAGPLPKCQSSSDVKPAPPLEAPVAAAPSAQCALRVNGPRLKPHPGIPSIEPTSRGRKRFGRPETAHVPDFVTWCQRRSNSLLERLVNGYWNYTDFLVVAPSWRVVVQHGQGTIGAEELPQ